MNYSKREGLIMPEYGRNIQQMVDIALSIEDREERTKCAKSIIAIMGNLFPYLRDVNDFKHKLWDHLAIMSKFKLDIDCPYEMMKEDKLVTKPDTVPYHHPHIFFRHYGENIEKMIDMICKYPEGTERDKIALLIADQMKKSYTIWNKDNVEDEKIFKDLAYMSQGRIIFDAATTHLMDCHDIQQQKGNIKNNGNLSVKAQSNRANQNKQSNKNSKGGNFNKGNKKTWQHSK